MFPFRYVGQHTLHFEHGPVEPDEEFLVPADRLEAFRHRPDMECLDSDAVAAHDAAQAAAQALQQGEPVEASLGAEVEPSSEPSTRRRRAAKNDESAPAEQAAGEVTE